jgi:DNA (cytosine-5)-methyltransferase 1
MTNSSKPFRSKVNKITQKPAKEVSERMRKVKGRGTSLENTMEKILNEIGVKYEKQPRIFGNPDFKLKDSKVVIFCDGAFWHGKKRGQKFHKNREFWESKIAGNKRRDERNNRALKKEGWKVLRFLDSEINRELVRVAEIIRKTLDSDKGELTAIDLFCGAGGLSLGLENAGFKVLAGVEVNQKIAKTYVANHPKTKLLIRDIRNVSGSTLLKTAGVKGIALLAGCPPCQGFSALTAKYRREDSRNNLVLEMARLVEQIEPKMVMMENVPGLATRGKAMLDEFIRRIEAKGYVVNKSVLQLADYGIPQSRRRFVLLAGKGFAIPIPGPTHAQKPNEKNNLKPWLTLSDVLKDAGKPVTLSQATKKGGPKKFNWHVVRNLSQVSMDRLKALKAGGSRFALPKKLRPKCHKETDKGFQNVYGRLDWKKTPPTITSGCTTPCMGRFGHPSKARTISVREAALIQTFPMNYKFETEFMDVACDLVGNALPPKFAKIVSKECLNSLNTRRGNST